MVYSIINAISKNKVPQWGNQKRYIAIHYLGVVGQNHDLAADGSGAHYYIYWDGKIYQRCSHDAVVWAVGTARYYTQKHPLARNANTISIEMCCKCDGNSASAEDKKWYFTEETQEACVWLVQKLMKELGIPAENVLRHYDIVNKTCPAPYVHNNKYRTSWTWEEFRAKISGAGTTAEPLYRVRRTWMEVSSQLFAGTLEGAKKACPAGYTVFDTDGKAVYANKIPEGTETDDIWMGWTMRETGKDGLRNIHGDSGRAYGLQFDYRYGLVPFLQFCVDYDAEKYATFKRFISLGVGNSALVYNKELGQLWQQFYDADPAEFGQLQYICAYNNYYLPAKNYVKQHYSINMDRHAPAVKGTLWSVAFRSGSETGAKKFSGCSDGMSDKDIINKVYPSYGSQDAGRWTKAGQWGDALKALESGEHTTIILSMDASTGNGTGNITETSEHRRVVQCGSFKEKKNAEKLVAQLKATGFDAIIKAEDGQYKVQCGAFDVRANAEKLVERLKAVGFDAIIK